MVKVTETRDLEEQRAAILDALDVRVQPPPVTAFYRLGLLLVSIALLLLPVVYIAIIALVGYGVYHHATERVDLASQGHSALWLYLLPIAIGGILVLFLVKPLFARPRREEDEITLDRDGEPFLFAFVEKLCDAVGARHPAEIRVDPEVNASASLDGAWNGLVRGRLVLTIGLPIVAGLTLRELAGVLAHEFGHFTQAAGMRAYYSIALVNGWLARVVHERDRWDERLVQASEAPVLWASLAGNGARFFVWITRRMLAALMWIGRAISSFMSRQMEFGADHYEIQLVGSDAFCRTAVRMTTLSIASDLAHEKLGGAWAERRLAEDYPGFVLLQQAHLPNDIEERIQASFSEEPRFVLATHPRSADRMDVARRAAAPGFFAIEAPPSVLFHGLEDLARAVSMKRYRRATDGLANEEHLVPLEEFVERDRAESEAVQAMQRYFQANVSFLRPLRLRADATRPPDEPEAARARLAELRERVEGARFEIDKELRKLWQVQQRVCTLAGAMSMVEIGIKIDYESFELPDAGLSTCRQAQRDALQEAAACEARLEPAEAALVSRLELALSSLASPKVASDLVDDRRGAGEVARLIDTLRILERLLELAIELDRALAALGYLVAHFEANDTNPRIYAQLESRSVAIRSLLETVVEAVGDRPYPFEHVERGTSWAAVLVPSRPREGDANAHLEAGDIARDRIRSLYFRAVGHLAVVAERVECILGFEPLPIPPDELLT